MEEVVKDFGEPSKRLVVGKYEILRYNAALGIYSNGGFKGGNSWYAYDPYGIYFLDGIAVKWDGGLAGSLVRPAQITHQTSARLYRSRLEPSEQPRDSISRFNFSPK